MTLKTSKPVNLTGVARDILIYLLENPDARDTMKGIAEWWLLDLEVERGLKSVERGLDQLVQADVIEAKRAGDGRLHYMVNTSRIEEIRTLLAGGQGDG